MRSIARGNPARWWKSRSCGGASRAPRGLFIGPFRRWFTRMALAFLLLFLGGLWYLTSPKRISRLSEALLSRVLGGDVKVRTGHLSFSGTLILNGIEVNTPGPHTNPSEDVPIFTAEQIEARFDWFSLLSGQLTATQLVATTPVFHPVKEEDGVHWNFERLRPGMGSKPAAPSKAKGMSLPVVVLHDAHVKFSEVHQKQIMPTAESIVDGELTPDAVVASLYHFQFNVSMPGGPGTDGTPVPGPSIQGNWDSVRNTFDMTTEALTMTDALRESLPKMARDWCAEHHLAGRLKKISFTFTPGGEATLTVPFDDVSMMWMVAPEQGMAVGQESVAYPLDVNNVRGQAVFYVNQNLIRIADLRGKILGYDFIADLDLQGTSKDAPFDLSLRFPGANVSDRYPPLFLASNTSQDLMQRMEPHGRMDIAVQVLRTTPRGDPKVTGQIDLIDARMRYAHFPMPMDHVRGKITFDNDSVTFHDVKAKSDLMDATITGTCGTNWKNRFVDMTVSSPNVLLDDRMGACLPEKYQEIWNLFSLDGKGSFTCRITRGRGAQDQQKIMVDLDIAESHGYLKAVPYPFSKGTGHLHLENENARIERFTAVTGADGSGRMMLDGVVKQSGEQVAELQPEIRLRGDAPLDLALLQALPESVTQKLTNVTLGGRIAFDGTVKRVSAEGTPPAVQVAGMLNWNQGTLSTKVGEEPVAFSGITAQAVLSPSAMDLRSLGATVTVAQQKVLLQIAGKLNMETFSGILKASLTGKDIELPAKAPALLSESGRAIWENYQPGGRVDVSAEGNLRVNLPENPQGAPALVVSPNLTVDGYTAWLTVHDGSMKERTWPDPLSKINGKVEFVPGTISMIGMRGKLGNIDLAWNGKTVPDTGKIDLTGDATSTGLPEAWLSHLPDALTGLLDRGQKNAALNLHLDSLTRDAEGKPWELQGKLQTTNLATAGAMPLAFEKADIWGKAVFTPADEKGGKRREPAWVSFLRKDRETGTFDFTGNFSSTSLSVSQRTITGLTAHLVADSKKHEITISELEGKVAEGVLQGNIRIRTSGPLSDSARVTETMPAGTDGGFVAELVLNDAELARLALSEKADAEERKKIGTGRVTASLSLQQTFGPNGDRTGRGDLIIRDGVIYNVPLSMGLMQIVTLRLPVASSFNQGSTSYYLRNNEVTFERILLESNGINLAGFGTVAIDSKQVNMSFITQSPHELNIPFITPAIGLVRDQLLEISVTGPADDPKVTPVPLSSISNLLRALLPRQSADGRRK